MSNSYPACLQFMYRAKGTIGSLPRFTLKFGNNSSPLGTNLSRGAVLSTQLLHHQTWECSIMIESGNLILKSHYEILDVKEDASSDEIRTCYRTAILSYHPDKMQTTSQTSNPANELGRRFLEVQRAWEILGDSKSRALYDNELQSSRQDSATAEDIRLEDLSIEEVGYIFELSYGCRCGDYFLIDSLELSDMGYPLLKNGCKIVLQAPRSPPASVVLPCGSCSLKVRLLINSDSKLQTELSN